MEYGQMLKALMIVGYLIAHPQGDPNSVEAFKLFSPAFSNAGIIPKAYTCRGNNISIPLKWRGVPKGTKSLVLLFIDEDVPRDSWYHWAVYNIPPTKKALPANVKLIGPMKIAANSWGHRTYKAPCPPAGEHHFMVYLYALDTVLPKSASHSSLLMRRLMRDHIIARTQLMGRVKASSATKKS